MQEEEVIEGNTNNTINNEQEIDNGKIQKLNYMKIKNFKSFNSDDQNETVIVGPFAQFNSIVGPNGTGKSNIIDALCFLFGVSLQSTRSLTLKALINNNIITPQKEAYVILNVNITRTVNGEERQNLLEFKRSIKIDENDNDRSKPLTQFYINNQEYTREDYTDLLESYNIIPEAKNFLLMQGETDSITNLDPESLTKYFEKLSGSYKYENDYNKCEKDLQNLFDEIKKKTLKVSQLKNERKKMKQIRSKNEEYQKLIQQIDKLERQQYLYQLLKLDTQLEFTTKQLNGLSKSKQDNQDQREEIRANLQTVDHELQELKNQNNQLKKEFENLQTEKTQGQSNLSVWAQEIRYKEGLLPTYQKSYEEAQQNVQTYQEIYDSLTEKLENIQKEINELEEQQQNQMNQNMSPEQRQKFELCQEKSKDQNYRYNQEISKINNELSTLQSEIDILKEDIQNNEQQNENQQNLIVEYTQSIDQKEQEQQTLKKLSKDVNKKIEEMEQQKQQYEKNKNQIQYLNSENDQLLNQIDILQNHLLEDQETDKIVFDLQTSVKGCHGTFGSNLQLNSNSGVYEKPLKQALGRILNYIVVEDTQSAIQCKKILNLKNTSKEFIILDKVPQFTSTLSKMEKLQRDNKSLQINIPLKKITSVRSKCEKQIKKCLEFFLHNKIFVQNYTKATNLQKMNLDYLREIIGIEDNSIINVNDGMIKTSAQNNTYDMYKFGNSMNYDKQQEFEKNRKNIQDKIQENTQKIQELKEEQIGQEYNSVHNQKYDIDQKIQILDDEIKTLKQKVIDLKKQKSGEDVSNLKYKLQKKEQEYQDQKQDLDQYIEELKNQDKKIFKEFCEEYGIEDINKFKEKDLSQIELIHKQIQQKTHIKNNIQQQLDENKLEKQKNLVEKFKNNIQFTEQVIEQLNNKIKNVENNKQNFEEIKNDYQQRIKDQNEQIEQKEEEKRSLLKQMQDQRSGNYQNNLKLEQLKNQISSIFQHKLQKIEQALTEGVELKFIEEEKKKNSRKNEMQEEDIDDELNDDEKKEKQKEFNYIDSQKLYDYMDDIEEQVLPSQTLEPSDFQDNKLLYDEIQKGLKQVKSFKQDYGVYQQINQKQNKMYLEDDEEEESGVREIKNTKKNQFAYNSKIQDKMDSCLEKIENWIKDQVEEINENFEEKQQELEEYHSKTLNEGVLGDNDAYQRLEDQIKNLEKDLNEKISVKQEISEDFDKIKKLRTETFKKLFDEVEKRINSNYKRINEGDKKNRIHCEARLYLQNKEEPYKGDLIYTPVPPGKLVVSDIESQLSGGEKTMATLALFFTVNEVLRTPFLILDETDAFLDHQNTKNYVKYLQNVTRKNPKQFAQCFVISHKKQVYDQAENFIGVTLNREQSSTQIFSFKNK